MDIYTDYGNWKFDNYDFITSLVKKQSKAISRFTQVIAVVDFLYEKRVKENKELSPEEDTIFDVGFNYIHDHFLTIQNLFEKVFAKNLEEMEKYSKGINLLLYVNDFENELLNATDNIDADMKKLEDFEAKVLDCIENKKEVPDAFFPLLDDIANPMFDNHGINFYSTEQIFYDIAIELDIYQEKDYDIFNQVFSNEIMKHRK